jgi:hypothetical protein
MARSACSCLARSASGKLHFGPGAREHGFIGPWIDLEQRLAGPDDVALSEHHRLDLPGHPRLQFDTLRSFDACHLDRRGVHRHGTHAGHGHQRRRRRGNRCSLGLRHGGLARRECSSGHEGESSEGQRARKAAPFRDAGRVRGRHVRLLKKRCRDAED